MLEPEVEAGDRLSLHVADLTDDAGLGEAIDGCDYVLHVASPFPPQQPKDPDELIVPAREGTLRGAANRPRSRREAHRGDVVRRGGRQQRQAAFSARAHTPRRTGATRPIPTSLHTARSKTIAEQSAWELVNETRRDRVVDGDQAQRDPRPGAQRRSLLLAAGDRAAAGRACRAFLGSDSASSTCATWPTCTSGR